MNALQIKNVVGCSYKLGAALFSSATNKLLRKADQKSQQQEDNKDDIELEEIQIKTVSSSKIPIPKPRSKFSRFIPTRLTNKKIQTSLRKSNKRSTKTQVDISDTE